MRIFILTGSNNPMMQVKNKEKRKNNYLFEYQF
jgi:hypothetical protein